jgi:hypothetical protein
MTARRKPVPDDIQQRVLDRSRRRCALCFHFNNDWERKDGQLAHLDRDPSNFAEDNLAFLCLPHHDEYDTKRRQTKNLTIGEAKTARDRLYKYIESGGDSATAGAVSHEADERRLSVIKQAVRAEVKRLETSILAVSRALPSAPQPANRRAEQLVIASSSLLRGERENIALLDEKTRALLEGVASMLDEYNRRIETAVVIGQGPLIDQEILDLIKDRLPAAVGEIRSVVL